MSKISNPINDKGQTAVEYLLLLGVVTIMIVTISKQIHGYMLPGGKCPKNSKSPLCMFKGAWQDPSFRYFSIKRNKW